MSHGSSGSSSSGGSHSSSSSSSASHGGGGGSHDGRIPVSGHSTWHQGGHGGYGGYGGYYGGYGGYYGGYGNYWNNGYWGNYYGPWWPRTGWWGIGWWGYYGPNYYDTAPYAYTRVYPNDDYGPYGALDTDISPERCQVFVNGKLVGVADDFDGFPTYLWLQQGVYDVVFYTEGFQTIARQYVIRPGQIISVEDDMTPGQAIKPQDLPARTHEYRDQRLQQDAEAERDAAHALPPQQPGDQSWREQAPSGAPGYATAEPGVTEDVRQPPARLRLAIEPGDASVYLDGRFIGTGSEIARLQNGLLVDAGQHRVEAVRPGRNGMAKDFVAVPGVETKIDLTLPQP